MEEQINGIQEQSETKKMEVRPPTLYRPLTILTDRRSIRCSLNYSKDNQELLELLRRPTTDLNVVDVLSADGPSSRRRAAHGLSARRLDAVTWIEAHAKLLILIEVPPRTIGDPSLLLATQPDQISECIIGHSYVKQEATQIFGLMTLA